MRPLFLASVAALSMLTASAAQAELVSSYPPAAFDVPYTGELTIWLVGSEQRMREICTNAKSSSRLACAKVWKDKFVQCQVYILKPEARSKELGGKTSFASLRHELAHCNGWGGDHAGGKKIPLTNHVKMPELPPSTRWLPAYPPVACITPDRTVEPCENRKPYWPEAKVKS